MSISTIHRSASLPIDRLPLSILSIFAGLEVKALIIVSSLREPLWYNSKLKDNSVSIPEAPVAACANVNLFDSSSSGLWSETITSIKLSFSPWTKANLSSSLLNGGDSFKKVLKSPISFSFNDRLLIETPEVNFTISFLYFITSTDFCEDNWDIWYLHFTFSSSVKSLSIKILSAISGMPDKPNLDAIIPEFIIPFLASS